MSCPMQMGSAPAENTEISRNWCSGTQPISIWLPTGKGADAKIAQATLMIVGKIRRTNLRLALHLRPDIQPAGTATAGAIRRLTTPKTTAKPSSQTLPTAGPSTQSLRS